MLSTLWSDNFWSLSNSRVELQPMVGELITRAPTLGLEPKVESLLLTSSCRYVGLEPNVMNCYRRCLVFSMCVRPHRRSVPFRPKPIRTISGVLGLFSSSNSTFVVAFFFLAIRFFFVFKVQPHAARLYMCMCCGPFAPIRFHFECCGVFDDSR